MATWQEIIASSNPQEAKSVNPLDEILRLAEQEKQLPAPTATKPMEAAPAPQPPQPQQSEIQQMGQKVANVAGEFASGVPTGLGGVFGAFNPFNYEPALKGQTSLNPLNPNFPLQVPPILRAAGQAIGRGIGGATSDLPVQPGPQMMEPGKADVYTPYGTGPVQTQAMRGGLEAPPTRSEIIAQSLAQPAKEFAIDPLIHTAGGFASLDPRRMGESTGELLGMMALPRVGRAVGGLAEAGARATLPEAAFTPIQEIPGAVSRWRRGAIPLEAAEAGIPAAPEWKPPLGPRTPPQPLAPKPQLSPETAVDLAFPELKRPAPQPLAPKPQLSPETAMDLTRGTEPMGLVNEPPRQIMPPRGGTEPTFMPGDRIPVDQAFSPEAPLTPVKPTPKPTEAPAAEGVTFIEETTPTEPQYRPAPAAQQRMERLPAGSPNAISMKAMLEESADPIGAMEQMAGRGAPLLAEEPRAGTPFPWEPEGEWKSGAKSFESEIGVGPNGEPAVKNRRLIEPEGMPIAEEPRPGAKKTRRAREPKSEKEGVRPEERPAPIPQRAAQELNTDAHLPGLRLTSKLGEKFTKAFPRAGAWLGTQRANLAQQAAWFLNPQYGGFLDKVGVRKAFSRIDNDYKGRHRESMTRIFGVDPIIEQQKFDALIDELTAAERANPDAIMWKRNLREGNPLTPAEQKFVNEHPQYVEIARRFYQFLDEARAKGLPLGDLGPTYYPIRTVTPAQVMKALSNWRQIFKSKEGRTRILANLMRQREGYNPVETTLADDIKGYTSQADMYESGYTGLSQQVKRMAKVYEGRGEGAAAELLYEYDRMINREMPSLDRQAIERAMMEVANDQIKAGDTFASDGSNVLIPEGEVKILRPKEVWNRIKGTNEPGFEFEVNGQRQLRALPEADLLGVKHSHMFEVANVTRAINGLNTFGALVGVGFRILPAMKAIAGNVGKTLAHEAWGNVFNREVINEVWTRRNDPAKLGEWYDNGINVDALRQVSENPADVRTPGGLKGKLIHAATSMVRLPDVIQQRVLYEARKIGLKKEFPGMSEQQIRDLASEWTQRLADVNVAATRAPAMRNPITRLFYLFKLPELRNAQLAWETAVDNGEWGKAAAQVGFSTAALYGMYQAAGGTKDAFKKALMEYFPVASLFGPHAYITIPALEISKDLVRKGVPRLVKGDIEGAASTVPAVRDARRLAEKGKLVQ